MEKNCYVKKGFLLVEVLVVVTIVSILLTISIPLFASQIENANATVCMENKKLLKTILSIKYLNGELKPSDITKDKISLTSENGYKYDNQTFTCPDGGTIYAQMTGLDIEIRCTYHDDEHPSKTKFDPWNSTIANKIWNILTAPTRKFSDADSLGSGRGNYTIQLNAALSEQGLSLEKLGATSWHFANNSYFMWTTADISKMNPGDTVTVMKYNLGGDYAGLYTVWDTKVESFTNDYGNTYNIITTRNANSEKTANLSTTDKKDLDKIIDVYNENADIKLEK